MPVRLAVNASWPGRSATGWATPLHQRSRRGRRYRGALVDNCRQRRRSRPPAYAKLRQVPIQLGSLGGKPLREFSTNGYLSPVKELGVSAEEISRIIAAYEGALHTLCAKDRNRPLRRGKSLKLRKPASMTRRSFRLGRIAELVSDKASVGGCFSRCDPCA